MLRTPPSTRYGYWCGIELYSNFYTFLRFQVTDAPKNQTVRIRDIGTMVGWSSQFSVFKLCNMVNFLYLQPTDENSSLHSTSSSTSQVLTVSSSPGNTLINSSPSSFTSHLPDTSQAITSSHILLSVPSSDVYTIAPLSHNTPGGSTNDGDGHGFNGDGSGLDGNEIDADAQAGNGLTRKYICPTCSKSFDRQYRLQRHLQIHNPNRPKVNCPMCDKFFTRMDTLENHIKCLHSDDRPYKCDFSGCNKSFPLQSSLIHHHKVSRRAWKWVLTRGLLSQRELLLL